MQKKLRESRSSVKSNQQLVMQIALGKRLPFGPDAMLKLFVETQANDRPFWLKPFLMHDDGTLEMIDDEEPILKHHFKVRTKENLTPHDREYHFLKNSRPSEIDLFQPNP
jgi:hypothetical protein